MRVVRKCRIGAPFLFSEQFLYDLNHILNNSIKDVPDFIRIFPSGIKNSHEKCYARV